jgi:hypothetical protein
MMSREEKEVVQLVYNRLIESEEEEWSNIDGYLELCSYMSDSELVTESSIKYVVHSQGVFRCSQEHDLSFCMAPRILDAVEAILALYWQTKELHPKNRYILEYYLTMCELRMLFNEPSSAI